MESLPKVSVNILNYNGRDFLSRCLNDVLAQEYPNFEVVLVDNNSSDSSLDFVRKNYSEHIKRKKLKILSLKKNYRFAEGYNQAYKKNNSPYFLLLSNDVEIQDKFLLLKMMKKILSNKKIGAVSVPEAPFLKRGEDFFLVYKAEPSIIQTNIFDNKKRERVFFPGGACCLVRRGIFSRLFDKEYVAYAEDTYLGARMLINGYINVYSYDTFIFHYGSGTTKKGSTFNRHHSEKNRFLNILLFYDSKTILKIFPLILFHSFVSNIFYLTRPKNLVATWKAYVYILKNLRKILKKRKIMQKEKKISEAEFVGYLSYKLFSEDLNPSSYSILSKSKYKKAYSSLAKILNSFSWLYCKLFKIKTREFK